ncbi:MAG: EAL domain-containing protein [Arcobacteraceae bacterium]
MKNINKIEEIHKLTKNLRVLYVEDDEQVREKFATVLRNMFDNVSSCSNGKEAITKYTEDLNNNIIYDIVITDMYMPVINGIELSKLILEKNNEQKILAISAYNDSDILESIIDTGISNYIQKPVKTERLLEVLHKIALVIEKEKQQNKQIVLQDICFKNCDFVTGFKNMTTLNQDLKTVQNKNFIIIYIKNFHVLQTLSGVEKSNSYMSEFECKLRFATNNSVHVYKKSLNKFIYLIDKKSNFEESVASLQEVLQNCRFNIVLAGSKKSHTPIETAEMALKFALSNGLKYKIYSRDIDLTNEYKNNERFSFIIDNAIEQENVFPVFQPICDKNKQILKYEVLMRIANNEKGQERIYYPAEFMKISMEENKFHDLSLIIIEKAFQTLQKSSKNFTINISYDDIKNDILLCEIEKQIVKYGNIGNRIILELLETSEIEDYELFKNFIKRFKHHGVKIAIDDFGSGYSNLNHIVNFHSDYIKIDGALIRNIQNDSTALTLVKSIVTFAKELGIKTIAEFVESETIFEILKEIEIDEFQGYYLSKPLKEIAE